MPPGPIHIRPELPSDAAAIRQVTYAAFRPMPFSDGDEHELIGRLREAGVLSVSLVAESDGDVVGHIAFSPAVAPHASGPWYALGPVAVLPAHQRSGIGSQLIRRGLSELENLGAAGCVLVGDPGYYARFGFELAPHAAPSEVPSEYFMIKLINADLPSDPIGFHPLFHAGT